MEGGIDTDAAPVKFTPVDVETDAAPVKFDAGGRQH
jgi:hypothetical protein